MSASVTEVWAVTMVRDELDILPYTVAHMVSEGVDGIIVADNMSTDGTWEWLQDTVGDARCELVAQRDEEIGYYQSRKMTALAHQAFALGATWVIPFDADELMYNAIEPVDVATTLRDWEPHSDCLLAPLFNYYGTSADDANDPVPFTRITHRDPQGSPLPKVVIHNRSDQAIDQGNHNARGDDEPYLRHESPLEIAHFPWRSREQFLRKVRNGAQAYRASTLPTDMGAHWRQYGDALDAGGPKVIDEIFDTHFFDPALKLEYRPAPFCRFDF